MRLIHDNLYKAYLDGSDIVARENLQLAALYPVPILWRNKEFRDFIDSVRVK